MMRPAGRAMWEGLKSVSIWTQTCLVPNLLPRPGLAWAVGVAYYEDFLHCKRSRPARARLKGCLGQLPTRVYVKLPPLTCEKPSLWVRR